VDSDRTEKRSDGPLSSDAHQSITGKRGSLDELSNSEVGSHLPLMTPALSATVDP